VPEETDSFFELQVIFSLTVHILNMKFSLWHLFLEHLDDGMWYFVGPANPLVIRVEKQDAWSLLPRLGKAMGREKQGKKKKTKRY